MHTLLIVDDDENILAGLRRALHGTHFQIQCATSAEEAFEVLRLFKVDAVVADEKMPGISGTMFLRRIRETHPDVVRVMLTGAATLDLAIEAINEAGVSYFFTKPCNPADLATVVRLALQQRDLVVAARNLLREHRRKSILLERIEKETPGITRVDIDDDGALIIGDSPDDMDGLIKAINRQITERRS